MTQIKGNKIIVDGKETQIYSGSIHYFRIHPDQWEDRLLKLKACGFNTVETYIAWNMHEPRKGEFCFSGMCDVGRFLSLAQKVGLYAIVRPGPYICAEWDAGGFPAWLLSDGCEIRCSDERYLAHVRDFFSVLLPKLKPHLLSCGGNIIAMQIENEYGSYGTDKQYLRFLKGLYEQFGMDCIYFTSDGDLDMMISGGSLPDVWKTVNFGSRTHNAFRVLGHFQTDMPKFCAEFWCGWFDAWGEKHHTRSTESVKEEVEALLAEDAGFNFYMFCGGTNFGFTAGANYDGKYTPDITSYDYCAPLTENGDYTPTYFMLRELLHEKRGIAPVPLPPAPVSQNVGSVRLTQFASLFENLEAVGERHVSPVARRMEEYGQTGGYILYRTRAEGKYEETQLSVRDVHDNAYVYADGERIAAFSRMGYGVFASLFNGASVTFPAFEGEKRIDVLVEALGRVNYGEIMPDLKGMSGVYLNRQLLMGYETWLLPMDNLQNIPFGEERKACPVFLKGTFRAHAGQDCFVDFGGFTKGCIFINGFALGRYWNIGPQRTLYVPGPVVHEQNEIVIFELEHYERPEIRITDSAKWDK